MYKVDFGNIYRIMNKREIVNLYNTTVDHSEYATFEDWMWDMNRCGLVTEIK